MLVDHVQRAAGVAQRICIDLQHDRHAQSVPPYRCRDVLQSGVIYRSARSHSECVATRQRCQRSAKA